jgi:ribosomal protein S18 acetylase RimI-like enzyme
MDAGMSIGTELIVRPLRPQDLEHVYRLVARSQQHDIGEIEVDREDLLTDWSLPGMDMSRDTVGVFSGTDLVAGAELTMRYRAEVYVAPEARDRAIGTWLREWTERRAAEKGWELVAQVVPDSNTAARELFVAAGYRTRHTAWVLRIDHGSEPPEPTLPDGIVIRPYRPEDEQAVYRLFEDAFNEWPGREPQPFEDWAAITTRRPDFRADLFALALDGDEVVGGAMSLPYSGEGWIDKVAVKATHRNRGIARALLLHSFREAWHRGERVSGLSTDSRTGALTLYEKVGMTVRRSYTSYAKDL